MSELFLTKPTSVQDKRKRRPRTELDFKEEVVRQLIALDIPREVSELAVIDFKDYVIRGHQNKESSLTIAKDMLPHVKRLYKERIIRCFNLIHTNQT